MLSNEAITTFWTIPGKALSSFKDKKKFLNFLSIFKFFKNNSGVKGLTLVKSLHVVQAIRKKEKNSLTTVVVVVLRFVVGFLNYFIIFPKIILFLFFLPRTSYHLILQEEDKFYETRIQLMNCSTIYNLHAPKKKPSTKNVPFYTLVYRVVYQESQRKY